MSAEQGLPFEATTLAVLRQARERRAAARRRMLPVVLAVLAVVVVASAREKPGIGLTGGSLGLTLALIGYAAGIVGLRGTLLVRQASAPVYGSVLGLLLVSSAVLIWVQPTGPGLGGCVIAIAVAMAAGVLPARPGIASLLLVMCFAVLVLSGVIGLHGHQTTWSGLAVNLVPVGAVFLLALVMWRLRDKEEQSARLLRQIEETRGAELRAAALAERQRLARDMHDVLAHSLSGLVLQLEAARLFASSNQVDVQLTETLDRAHQLARSGLDEARRAIGMLRDDRLPGPGMLPALAETFETDTGVPCRLTVTGEARELGSAVKLALYRVTQEALTNVRKHAHPDRVGIRLDYEEDEVGLSVEDFTAEAPGKPEGSESGPGGDLAGDQSTGGYGLTGMRERAELLGGTLSAGKSDHGFLIRLRMPA
jgi:signal transduction histidine kinase